MKRTLILDRWTSARQLRPRDVYFWLKALLLALVAVQGVRLFWSIVTPLGPVGNWLPATPQTLPAAAQIALISTFDPFSRGRPQAVAVATSAMPEGLKLFGTRMGSGSIAGSAIADKFHSDDITEPSLPKINEKYFEEYKKLSKSGRSMSIRSFFIPLTYQCLREKKLSS